MADRIPIFGPDFKAWSPSKIRWSWLWVYCVSPFCNHARAIPLAPWRIRWNVRDPSEAMRRNFFCSVCGRKGCCFVHPTINADGIEAFPARAEAIRMSGERRTGESFDARDARVLSEYLTRYPSGDAISNFQGGPSGPASMCGKFTAMSSWSEVVAFSQLICPLPSGPGTIILEPWREI